MEVGLLGLRRTGLDMVSSSGDTVDGRVRAEYARWRRAKGDSPLQPSREGLETNLQINPSTHDTCNAYFDQNTTRLVMQEQRAIYSAFGYVRRAPSPHAPTNILPTRSRPHVRPRPHPPCASTPTPLPSPPHPDRPAASRFVRRFSAVAREEHPPICRRSRAGQGALTFCGRWRPRQRIGTRAHKVENAPTPGKYLGRRCRALR